MLQGIWYECGSKEAPFRLQPEDCEKLISRDIFRVCSHDNKAYHKTDKHEHVWGIPMGHNNAWVVETEREY